jgi:hypothetical protein
VLPSAVHSSVPDVDEAPPALPEVRPLYSIHTAHADDLRALLTLVALANCVASLRDLKDDAMQPPRKRRGGAEVRGAEIRAAAGALADVRAYATQLLDSSGKSSPPTTGIEMLRGAVAIVRDVPSPDGWEVTSRPGVATTDIVLDCIMAMNFDPSSCDDSGSEDLV